MKITKKKKLIPFIQSILSLVLIVFVMLMMAQIRNLQGTARVINYAGLVRGATQRTIKLEIAERPNDDLIVYLDEVLEDLKHGECTYQLVKLNDRNYQQCLDAQISYWEQLKNEIYATRESGYEATNIVEMSETYFDLADETVTAAEVYSEQIAIRIRWIEYISAVDMFLLFLAILVQYLSWLRIARTNSALEKKAYLDVHTGLPNKSRCEELLRNTDPLPDSIGFIMFDLNNLKSVNGTLGHATGDSLISAFARIVRNTVPEKDFVGRFGEMNLLPFCMTRTLTPWSRC